MFNKARKYLQNNRPEKALPLFKRVLKDGGDYKEVFLNIGNCYKSLQKDDLAAEYYLKAANPRVPFTDKTFIDVYPAAMNNLGMLAGKYKNYATAEEFFYKAITKDPDYADALWNMANLQLMYLSSNKQNDTETCWRLYEYRFLRSGKPVVLNSRKKLETWDGRPVESLCVLAEQGFGDQLQFGRYLELAAAVVGKLTVQCAPRMRPIFDKYNVCEDPSETDATHGIGICSLARIFNEKIPSGDWLRDKYNEKPLGDKLQVAVTWSGNRNHANDHNRSTVPGTFRCLRDFADLYTINPTENGTNGFSALDSDGWDKTIKALESVDLVVSVDTSIVHLCGALGKPCWLVMPLYEGDWRWGDDSMGHDNVWYSSVKVFRNQGSWENVMKEVCDELKKLSDGLRAL